MMYKRFIIIPLFLLMTASGGWAESPRAINHKGVEAWKAGEYDEALKQFKNADKRSEEPNLQVRYNMGAALAADGKLDEALEAFGEVAGARDKALNNAALFGQGVVSYQQALKEMEAKNLDGAKERVGAALQSNRAVLRSDPTDNDARINYEKSDLLKKKIEQQMQQQQENKDQEQNKDENKKDENKEDQQKKDDQQSQDDQKKEDENKEQDQNKNGEQDQQQPEQDQKNGEKSEEEKKAEQSKSEEKKGEEQKQDQQEGSEGKPGEEQEGQPGEQKEMTPEEMAKEDQRQATLSILNLLEENDMEALQRMLKQRFGKMSQPKKDW